MIAVGGLGKSFGNLTLFAGVSFRVNAGERFGLVGANGSGKTTLLKILAGDIAPSEGTVSISRGRRVGVLRQDRFAYEDESVLSVALMGNRELWEATVAREALLAEAGERFDAARFSELEETFERHGGYTAEARAAEILEGLGVATELHQDPLSTLSGGLRLRVLLAQVLAGAPDALLLDEPTNHLDILSIRWLEQFLRAFQGAVVVISHDHRFLDRVATHLLDIDYETATVYPGGYSGFVRAKREERERREKEILVRQREIAHHQRFVDRFRAKASKARQAQNRVRMIEKRAEALVQLPQSSRRTPRFRFEQARPSGREVVKLEGVSKSFGDNRVLDAIDLEVARGDRLAVVGPNGVGKSTLLKALAGRLAIDAGKILWGYETRPGYFAQDPRDHLGESRSGQTAEDWIGRLVPEKGVGYALAQLGLVLLGGDDARKPISALSGGEAARLVFCGIMVRNPNVLLLDEPTNHLDLESIEALAAALEEFPGTLIFVSHDRWFVERLANHILEIMPSGACSYRGGYREYVRRRGDDHLDAEAAAKRARRRGARREEGDGLGKVRVARARVGTKRSQAEVRRLAARARELADRVDRAEERLGEIDSVFADVSYYERADRSELLALESERRELAAQVDRLVEEWEAVETERGS